MSAATVITAIETTAQVIQSITAIVQAGEQVVEFTEKCVKQVETEADANVLESDSKFIVVLKYVEAFCEVIGVDWGSIQDKVEDLINSFVDTYNTIGLFHKSSSETDSDGADA